MVIICASSCEKLTTSEMCHKQAGYLLGYWSCHCHSPRKFYFLINSFIKFANFKRRSTLALLGVDMTATITHTYNVSNERYGNVMLRSVEVVIVFTSSSRRLVESVHLTGSKSVNTTCEQGYNSIFTSSDLNRKPLSCQ